MQAGSLCIVGTGVGMAGQLSAEARAAIVGADSVLTLTGDPLFDAWLDTLNEARQGLEHHYAEAPDRPSAYARMSDHILAEVRMGKRVCAAFYGHPGVFVTPSHDAIQRARAEGFAATMLPGISAEDCLFADLGVDPGACGCQSYEARDFFVHARQIDTSAALILWQIAVVGDGEFANVASRPGALRALSLVLRDHYPDKHRVAIYVAATVPTEQSGIQWTDLELLEFCRVDQASTLYVPPARAPQISSARLQLLQLVAASQ